MLFSCLVWFVIAPLSLSLSLSPSLNWGGRSPFVLVLTPLSLSLSLSPLQLANYLCWLSHLRPHRLYIIQCIFKVQKEREHISEEGDPEGFSLPLPN